MSSLADLKTLRRLAFALVLAAVPLVGQCELQWQPGSPVSGVNGNVNAMVPAPGLGEVYVAGDFIAAGSNLVGNVAHWDGNSWSGLGLGLDGPVYDAVAMPNGDLVVAGWFATAGGSSAANIARWDGTSWSAVGLGFDASVSRLLVLPNGDLVAHGAFTMSGTTAVSKFARWDGTSWSQFASGTTHVGSVRAMQVMPNGDFVVGGLLFLPAASSFPALGIWNGTNWIAATTPGLWLAHDLQVLPSGDLAIVGSMPGGERFARWDGTSFTFEAVPSSTFLTEIALHANGDLIGVGPSPPGSLVTTVVRRSNGVWTSEFSHSIGFQSMAVGNGYVFVGGTLIPEAGDYASVYGFDGTTWSQLGSPSNGLVTKVAGAAGRASYAGGSFSSIDGVAANNVAFFDGASWHALGNGVNGEVREIEMAPDGAVVVTGEFTTAGGVPANLIARWNGISWSTLGNGLVSLPRDIAVGPAGEVAALTHEGLQVFAGNTWTLIPLPTSLPTVGNFGLAITFLPNGDLIATGGLTGSDVQVWDGTAWTEIGLLEGTYHSAHLEVTSEGRLVHAGRVFTGGLHENLVHEWDGTSWNQLGASFQNTIRCLQALPNGDLVVGGEFFDITGGLQNHVAYWNGQTWTDVDGGVDRSALTGAVSDLTVNGDGELWMAGGFTVVGSQISPFYARAVSSCPATATVFGAGCTGSNGPMTLEPLSKPWLGTTLRSRATGFTQVSFAVHLVGTNPTVLPLPGGAPGCFQLLNPALFELHAPNMGEVVTSFAVPNVVALVGQSFRTQLVGLEFDALLALTGITSTNALDLTIGSY
tara:strand:+ start:109625 stop:112060 length:2436 start_codon:yes stop_codon:yes gene_type:complete